MILVTRIDETKAKFVLKQHPYLQYHATANIVCTPIEEINKSQNYISVLCAGTSDLAVAEEAALTAEVMGIKLNAFTTLACLVFIDYSIIFMKYAKVRYP